MQDLVLVLAALSVTVLDLALEPASLLVTELDLELDQAQAIAEASALVTLTVHLSVVAELPEAANAYTL